MRAAFYDRYGPAVEVLQIGELPDLEPGPGERVMELTGNRGADVIVEAEFGANVATNAGALPTRPSSRVRFRAAS